jgi:hypothetical protein
MKLNKTEEVAAEAAEVSSTFPLVFLPLEEFGITKDVPNRATDKDHVADLKASIKANGLDTAIGIWKPEGKQMKLGDRTLPSAYVAYGFHRRLALKELAKEEPAWFAKQFPTGIPCRVYTGDLKSVLCAQLRENCDRKNPELEELLPVIDRLSTEFKMDGKAIAKNIGKSASWVSMVKNIKAELGEEATEKVVKGKVSLREASKLAKKVKAAKKEGKSVDVDEEVEKKVAQRQSGAKKAVRRVSLAKVWGRYKALPSMSQGARLEILENAVRYCLEELALLPKQLREEDETTKKAA